MYRRFGGMSVTRVWFNHWFSTVGFIMDLIREDTSREYCILASNDKDNLAIASKADEWFKEPYMSDGEAYVDYCLSVCKDKSIDVFIPRRHRDAISKRASDFKKLGVKLVVSSNDILNNKVSTYKTLEADEDLKKLVPYYKCVGNVDEFDLACDAVRKATNGKICMKYAEDEGASSFKILVKSMKELEFEASNKITDSLAKELLGKSIDDKTKFKHSIMVMPYMTDEVSCDCLRVGDKTICVVRKKLGAKRCHLIKHDAELQHSCAALIDKFNINGPCNIQFRRDNSGWKLLEINTRMSGGVQLSSLGSGVNIPMIAVKDALGDENIRWTYNKEYMADGVKMFNLETPYFA